MSAQKPNMQIASQSETRQQRMAAASEKYIALLRKQKEQAAKQVEAERRSQAAFKAMHQQKVVAAEAKANTPQQQAITAPNKTDGIELAAVKSFQSKSKSS